MKGLGRLQFIPPMLLRRVHQLPEGADWHYEVKWDGYRMQAIKCNGEARLLSRNGADYSRRFPEVTEAVRGLRARNCQLDGELVAMDAQGRPSFQVLQGRGPLPSGWGYGFYLFDVLHWNGRDLQFTPLIERRKRLPELANGRSLRFSPALEGSAEAVLAAVRGQQLEGVVAKRGASHYDAGKRSSSWVKMPLKHTERLVIGGFRPSGKDVSVLLVGRYKHGAFRFLGKVRHGVTGATRAVLFQQLWPLRGRECPFVNLPNCKEDPFDEMVTPEEMSSFCWVEPVVEVEVAFSEWTRFGVLRHAELVQGVS